MKENRALIVSVAAGIAGYTVARESEYRRSKSLECDAEGRKFDCGDRERYRSIAQIRLF